MSGFRERFIGALLIELKVGNQNAPRDHYDDRCRVGTFAEGPLEFSHHNTRLPQSSLATVGVASSESWVRGP